MPRGQRNRTFVLENIKIEDYAAEGKCIAHHEGEVIFVEGIVAPGDVADIRVHKSKKNYKEATVLRIGEESPLRVQPFCSHFGVCGGCKWQHLSYENQLGFKTQQVTDALTRIAKVKLPSIQPILPAEQTQYYRNKLEFTFCNARWLTNEEIESGAEFDRNVLGFHVPKRFDKVIEIDHCYHQVEPSNAIRKALSAFAREQKYVFYDHVKQEGFARNVVIRTTNTGDLMVILIVARPEMDKIQAMLDLLMAQFPEITSLYYIVNQKMNDSFHDQEPILVKGKAFNEEKMEDLTFRIGPKSFYQTNSKQAYNLYKVARDFAQLRGNECVYDLYTGTGTIANFVAKQARKVIGVEYIQAAIADAKINSSINGITNTAFFAGDMRKLLTPTFIEAQGKPDVIITDPPRAGMDKEVIDTILEANPQRIVYVSCNPATQARDLALLDVQYQVTGVQPVDMFPHTHHVENVVALERK